MNALPVTRCGPAVWEVERSKLLGRRYYSTPYYITVHDIAPPPARHAIDRAEGYGTS